MLLKRPIPGEGSVRFGSSSSGSIRHIPLLESPYQIWRTGCPVNVLMAVPRQYHARTGSRDRGKTEYVPVLGSSEQGGCCRHIKLRYVLRIRCHRECKKEHDTYQTKAKLACHWLRGMCLCNSSHRNPSFPSRSVGFRNDLRWSSCRCRLMATHPRMLSHGRSQGRMVVMGLNHVPVFTKARKDAIE